MKLAIRFCLIIIFIVLMLPQASFPLYAQGGEQLKFENLTRKDGVSGSEIRNVIQDEQGRIWFGTRFNGVDVYDGYDIKVYTHDPNDPRSLAGDPAFSVYKDSRGTIWVSTLGAGLSKFNPETETFTTYRHDPDDPTSIWDDSVQFTFEDKDGNFWVAAANGLDKMDRETGKFTHFSFDPNEPVAPSNQNIKIFYQDSEGSLWLGLRRGGLRRIDPATGQVLEAYVHDPNDPDSISDDNVFAILEDHTGTFWVGSWQGLNILDRETGKFTHIQAEPDNPHGLSDRRIFTMLEDSNNTLWVGTGVGLNKYNYETGEFSRYFNDPNNPHSLVHNEVLHLYEDTSGILWISTLSGISKLDLSPPKFTTYRATSSPNSLNSNDVEAILEDSHGSLWFAAEGILNKWNPQPQTFTHYQQDPNAPEPLGYIDDIFEDSDGMFWLGNQNGLHQFDPKTGAFSRYPEHPDYPLGEEIRHITQDQAGYLWLNVQGAGLKRVDPETGVVVSHYYHDPNDSNTISDDYINHIYLTPDGVLWIGSEGGLDKLDINTEMLTRFSFDLEGKLGRDPSNDIQHIYASPTGTLWVSTIAGLNAFDPATGDYTTYTTEDGLPSNLVQWTSEDTQGNLWVGTANGLVKFNPQTRVFRHYDVADGLAGIELSNDMIKSSWGEIFFVSINEGVNAFYPDEIKDNPYVPPVILTDFQLSNRSIRRYGEGSVLPKPINELDTLTLAYDQSVFTLDFAALNYKIPEKNLYQYKLEGFDQEWSPVGKKRSATYTNLDPGEYVFRVRGSNNDRVWNEAGKSLRIVITPPWWETAWFRLAALATVAVLLYAAYRWRVLALEQRSRALKVEVAERTRELAAHTEKLSESEKRFREMTELLPGAVVEIDADFTVTYVNRSGLEMFGYSEEDINAGLNGMELIHPEDRERATRRIAEQLAGKDLPPTEYRVLKKDGAEIPILMKAAPIQQEGEITGFRASITDIAEIKETQQELAAALDTARRLQDEAEVANRAKSTFLANMSHELRTPLNAIIGFTQIIARSKTLPPKQQENLRIINRSGEHLLALINQVLELSKIEAGRIALNKTIFDLHQMLTELEGMFRLRADDRQIRLVFERSPDVPRTIRTDEVKLRQVLINLLNNALKFTKEGSVTLRVGCVQGGKGAGGQGKSAPPHLRTPAPLLSFEVSDTGPGITSTEIPSLFEAFSQTETGQQAQEGTGLGLPISRKFVQLLGGDDIRVESPAQLPPGNQGGPGATFAFDIQVEVVDSAKMAEKPYSGKLISEIEVRVVSLAPNQPRYRLLVVDDDPTNRQLLLELFAPLGFDLREAENGRQAIEIWQAFHPHLIWMDMRMPVMDGYEATKRIKKAEGGRMKDEERSEQLQPSSLRLRSGQAFSPHPSPVIIALTASSFEEDKARTLAVGCDDYLRKPFREADLFQMISRHIGVQFVYETPDDSSASPDETENILTPEMMARLSPDDLTRLTEAIELSDIELVNQVIADIRPSQPELAEILSRLIDDFEYEPILTAIEQVTS